MMKAALNQQQAGDLMAREGRELEASQSYSKTSTMALPQLSTATSHLDAGGQPREMEDQKGSQL